MPDYHKAVIKLQDPNEVIKFRIASSPYILRELFSQDPTILKLIRGGVQVVKLIDVEIKEKAEKLDEVTIAAYSYILENIDSVATSDILKPLYRQAAKKPGPYFVHFATHFYRRIRNLSVNDTDPTYSRNEIEETLKLLK